MTSRAEPVAKTWAADSGATLSDVFVRKRQFHVAVLGGPRRASQDELREALDEAGLSDVDVVVDDVVGETRTLPGGSG